MLLKSATINHEYSSEVCIIINTRITGLIEATVKVALLGKQIMIGTDPIQKISKLLGVTTGTLENFIKDISRTTGKADVLEKI
ncbi:MAG: hypothetical protein AAB946_03405, partial [Patescibacteria group bacterium]